MVSRFLFPFLQITAEVTATSDLQKDGSMFHAIQRTIVSAGIILFLTCFTTKSIAQKHWRFELHGGVLYNLPLPLVIRQDGYPEIRIANALFASEPLIDPYYWDWRFSRRVKNQGFEFEAIHQKLYLLNKPPEVQRFGISHGFNMLMVNYLREYRQFYARLGTGMILLHAESTIRNMPYPEGPGFDIHGYVLRGAVLNAGIGRTVRISDRFHASFEGKMTAATAKAPIVMGHARVHNVAFQFLFGLGVSFARKEGE